MDCEIHHRSYGGEEAKSKVYDRSLYKQHDDAGAKESLIEYEARLFNEPIIADRVEPGEYHKGAVLVEAKYVKIADDPEATPAQAIDEEPEAVDDDLHLVGILKLVCLCLAQVGSSSISIAYLSILLPSQILAEVGNDSKGVTLGALSAAAGVLSIIMPPFVGYISDKHEGRFGRRKPFMFSGLAIVAVGLILCGAMETLGLAAIISCYFFITIGGIVFGTAFNATIPDMCPRVQFGTISGIVGALTVVGFACGAGFGAVSNTIGYSATYYSLAGLVAITGLVTLALYEEDVYRPKNVPVATEVLDQDDTYVQVQKGVCIQAWEVLKGMASPFYCHDFRWVFVTRLLMQFGVFTIQEFLLYWVEEVLVVDALSTTTRTAILFIPVFIGAFISSLVVGRVSDKLGGKRKGFLIGASFGMATCSFAVSFLQSFYVALAILLLFGLCMGIYLALDYALICDVLPDGDNIARDLGVWHISIVLPQVIAAPIAGVILDATQKLGKDIGMPNLGYSIIFLLAAIAFLLSGVGFFALKNVK